MDNATHLAKDSVLAIEVRRRHCGDEKLASVGVGASIGHRQQVFDVVFQGKAARFVSKLFPVNALAAGSVAIGKVSALAHEIGNDSVKS